MDNDPPVNLVKVDCTEAGQTSLLLGWKFFLQRKILTGFP